MTDIPPPVVLRSALYMPASNSRALDKARTLPCDALIFDLEDAVAPDLKADARSAACAAAASGAYGARTVAIRMNAVGSALADADLAAIATSGADALVIPKVSSATQVAEIAVELDKRGAPAGLRLWLMIETPAAVQQIDAIASASPRIAVLIMGLEDLAKDLGVRRDPARRALFYAMSRCIMAARACGLAILDGVYPALSDTPGLITQCAQARELGFDGKTLIHPNQIEPANQAFGPSGDELAHARAVIAAFEAAQAEGKGLATLDGAMIEALHVEEARGLLAISQIIEHRRNAGT